MKQGLGELFEPNNFTQQTNHDTLNVDKHMCVIITMHVYHWIHSIA
jgi:hypothetical protein